MEQQQKIKILDGAVGSLLQSKFAEMYDKDKWMNQVLVEKSDELYKIHLEYCEKGADIITTFTFKTNAKIYTKEESQALVSIAVKEAKRVQTIYPEVQIYGSNSPVEHCYEKRRSMTKEELYKNHKQHIEYLVESKVDCILNETMSHLDELIIVCQICEQINVPYIISLYFDNNLQILSGEKVDHCVRLLLQDYNFKPLCLSFNCIQYRDLLNLLQTSKHIFFPSRNNSSNQQKHSLKYGFYVNCGGEDYSSNNLNYEVTPVQLSQYYKDIINLKIIDKQDIQFLGSCCISTPQHTYQLALTFK